MRDIIFMGRVMASVTHEMQNVMAIIKESGALAEDIMALNPVARLKHGDKLAPALANIREQIERGRGLMQRLNGFAHAAEDFSDSCDLVRFAEQISVLAGRAAAMRECSLRLELGAKPLPVRGNALLVMQSLYLALGDVLFRCPKGSIVTVSVSLSKNDGQSSEPGSMSSTGAEQTALRVYCQDVREECVPGDELTGLMAELGGRSATMPQGLVLEYQACSGAYPQGEPRP